MRTLIKYPPTHLCERLSCSCLPAVLVGPVALLTGVLGPGGTLAGTAEPVALFSLLSGNPEPVALFSLLSGTPWAGGCTVDKPRTPLPIFLFLCLCLVK